jgi:hypothetical protein
METWFESITSSLRDTLSNITVSISIMEPDPSGVMFSITKPRRCSELIATSILIASMDPLSSDPV